MDSGTIIVEGKPTSIRVVQDAIRAGIGYLPENRLVQGLILQQGVDANLVMTGIDRLLGKIGLIDYSLKRQFVEKWIRELDIKVSDASLAAQTLSGGNQQRVVLAKWLAIEPKILILDGPTVGIDIAAKSAIHEIIRKLADTGVAVIVISDDAPELMNTSNRILVMKKGRIFDELVTAETTEGAIENMIGKSIEQEN